LSYFNLNNFSFIVKDPSLVTQNISGAQRKKALEPTMNALYFKPFDTDVSCLNAGVKWQEYLEGFNNFMIIHDIKDDNRMICTLLHVAGEQVVRIFATLRANTGMVDHATLKQETDTSLALQVPRVDKFPDMCKKMTDYYNPKRSKMYERHVFTHTKQKPDEDIMSFVTRLRTAARYCEYVDTDEMICGQVLSGGTSEWLTTRAFQDSSEPTLESIMKLATTKAVATTRAKVMKEESIDHNEEVNNVGYNQYNRKTNQSNAQRPQTSEQASSCGKPCNYCGITKVMLSVRQKVWCVEVVERMVIFSPSAK